MGRPVELRQLRYFLTVSETLSFTRAAQRLYVSQPAVTSAVRQLEDELGITLFDRSQKNPRLTAEGRLFHDHVATLMQGISSTLAEIEAIRNLDAGVLRAGTVCLGGMSPFVGLLYSFVESYPNITLRLTEDTAAALQHQLEESTVDVALLWQSSGQELHAALPLKEQELVLCCSRGHRLRRKNTVSPAEFISEHLILPADPDYLKLLRESLDAPDLEPFMSVGQIQTIKSLVAAGVGITLLPECLTLDDASLSTAALEGDCTLTPVLLYRSSGVLPRTAQALIDLARSLGDDHAPA